MIFEIPGHILILFVIGLLIVLSAKWIDDNIN